MTIEVLKSKIHRVKVTDADLNYIGSITIDVDLMQAANLIAGEKVQVVNINNGERLETYVISAPENSGEICINGAAAHLIKPEDKVIIVAYCSMDNETALNHKPTIVHVDSNNKIIN
mgnify:CR=1 FL=1